MTTGQKIKNLRSALGMTQEELGAKIGVKYSAIYKYENGLVVNLKRSTIEKLADALNTTPSYLLGFDDDADAPSISSVKQELINLIDTLPDDTVAMLLDVAKRIVGQ